MEILETIGFCIILLVMLGSLLGVIKGRVSSTQKQLAEQLEEATEEKYEDSVPMESEGEEKLELEEYIEVPAPLPEQADNKSYAVGFSGACVTIALLVAAGTMATRMWRSRRRQDADAVAKEVLEQYKTATFLEYTGSVGQYLDDIDDLIGDRLSAEDRSIFAKVRLCAKAFDGISENRGETYARVVSIYIPAVKEIVSEISKAPSKRIATELVPYFHRACDVLKDAMERELMDYQKNAAFKAETSVKAMEQFAALKNDIDDEGTLSLSV